MFEAPKSKLTKLKDDYDTNKRNAEEHDIGEFEVNKSKKQHVELNE
jgi:hypothetical protein